MTDAPPLPNLFADIPAPAGHEEFREILSRPGCRIERIVSQGQVTPADAPYVQDHDEWVLLLAGKAVVALADRVIVLAPGDHLMIPAGAVHRVTFTDPAALTIWLAIHFDR